MARGFTPRNLSLREVRLLASFIMLEQWQKTPADLGLDWDEVDPMWQQAMMRIKQGLEQGRALTGRRSTSSPH